MRCSYCGTDSPDNNTHRTAHATADAPRRCEGCDRELPPPPAGSDSRDFRPVTSLVDKPVDPAMIDETPPARPKRIAELEEDGLDEEQDGRRSMAGEELQESAPIGPDDLKPFSLQSAPPFGAGTMPPSDQSPPPGTPPAGKPAAEESGREIPDFGEARHIPERGAGRDVETEEQLPVKGPRENDAWPGDQWNSFRADARRETPHHFPKGGFWIRAFALLIDTVFLYLLGWTVLAAVAVTTGFQDAIIANRAALEQAIQAGSNALMETLEPLLAPYADTFGITLWALAMVSFLYRPLCHATWGKTLGKWFLGLRVITIDGAPLGLGKATLRFIGYMIAIIPLSFGLLWVVFDPQKQGWHDRIASTYVIKERG